MVEAEFEVVEAAALEGAEVFVFCLCELVWLFIWELGEGKGREGYTICCEEGIERLSEDVDNRRSPFALPMEHRQLFKDPIEVC